MAYQSKRPTDTIAWMGLKSDDQRLPEELRDAVAALEDARETIERLVRELKPAPKGRVWRFAYKHGVAIGLAEQTNASGVATTSYFD